MLFYTLSNVPRPEDLPVPQVAIVQYSDGSTLARIGTTNRIPVLLAKVPKQVHWAVLAAEDRNFYSEPGVSIKGTLRAALNDLTRRRHPGRFGHHPAVRQERLPQLVAHPVPQAA